MSLFYDDTNNRARGLNVTIAVVIALVILVTAAFGATAFGKSFTRSQRLADERNQVQVNDIQIAQTAQLVKVQQQKAQIKIEEAKGIAEAQKIINQTLTPLYLQHEAIQAQEQMANSKNHTTVYIPSGSNGIPLVQTVN